MMTTVEFSHLIVFIPAAGRGTRASGTSELPKPLITVGGVPLIVRVMMQYPADTQFIVAVGFKADWIKQVVSSYALSRSIKVEFVTTDSWQSPSKGLAHTILDAKALLRGNSFIFHAVDGLFSESAIDSVLNSKYDAVVMCPPNAPATYRTIENNDWVRVDCDNLYALPVYTGLSVIHDTDLFFRNLDHLAGSNPEGGETIGLDPTGLEIINLTKNQWLDFGTSANIEKNLKEFPTTDIVLEKSNEAIWNIDGRMLKFHESPIFISQRVERAKTLSPYVPKVHQDGENLFSYERIEGITLSKEKVSKFRELLHFLNEFWFRDLDVLAPISEYDHDFVAFYKEKTLSRVHDFRVKYPSYDVRKINGQGVGRLDDLLAIVDWEKLCAPVLVRAHGDLHPDNIIVTNGASQFQFLDWRQELAGITSGWGDLYYDLGKLRHGLIVDHEAVSKDEFHVHFDNLDSSWSISQSDKKRQWLQELDEFIVQQQFDAHRANVMTALIFINIASLHHKPYDMFLMLLGHSLLFETSIPGNSEKEMEPQ